MYMNRSISAYQIHIQISSSAHHTYLSVHQICTSGQHIRSSHQVSSSCRSAHPICTSDLHIRYAHHADQHIIQISTSDVLIMQISTSSYRSVHQICTSDQIIMHISTSYRSAHEFCASCRSTHHTYLHIIQHIRSFSHAHHPPKFHVLQCICFQYCKEIFNLGMLNVIIHRSEHEVVEQ